MKKKITPSELEEETQRLIREGKLPSLERLLTVMAQVVKNIDRSSLRHES